jgi:hypothetical protein
VGFSRLPSGKGGIVAQITKQITRDKIIKIRLFPCFGWGGVRARARWMVPWADSDEKPAIYHTIARVVEDGLAC